MLLFDGGTMPLAPFGPKLSARAAKALTGMGVELHMGSIVTSIDAHGLDAKDPDGTVVRHEAGTVLWTAGVAAPPLAEQLAKQTGRRAGPGRPHRGAARPHHPGHPEISVVGDLMSLEHLPGVAEVAMQTGFYAAHRIKHQVEQRTAPRSRSGTTTSARPRTSPEGVPSSRSSASTPAGSSAGWPGSGIHLAFLTSFRNRISAVLTWAIAFSRESRRERAFTMMQIVPGQDVYQPQPEPDQRPEGARP